jgi:hypothetical protein
MFILDYQTPETAREGVAEIYDHFLRKSAAPCRHPCSS